jgi:hypothetical protein
MNESEFRDWLRGQLRSLEDRIRRVEGRPEGTPKLMVDGRIFGGIDELVESVRKRVAEKTVAGLAIAFVTVDGDASSGFAAAAGTYFQLAGAASLVGLEVLEGFRQAEAAALAKEAVK